MPASIEVKDSGKKTRKLQVSEFAEASEDAGESDDNKPDCDEGLCPQTCLRTPDGRGEED